MKSKPFNSQPPSPPPSPPSPSSPPTESSSTYLQNPNPNSTNNLHQTDSGIFPTFNFMESNFADSLMSRRKYVKVKKHSIISKPVVVDDDDSLNLGKTSPNGSNSGSDSNKLRFTFGANDEFKLGSKVESSGNDFVFGATNKSEANGTTVETTTNVNDSHLVDSLSELNLGTDGGLLMNDNKCKAGENDASENVGFLFPSHQKQESKVKSGDSVNDTLEDSGVMFGNGEFNGGFQIGNQNDKRSTVKGKKKPADKKLNSRRAESSSGNNSFTFKVHIQTTLKWPRLKEALHIIGAKTKQMKSKPFNSQQPSPPPQLMSAPLEGEDLTSSSSSSQSSTTYFQNPNPNPTNHQTTDSGIFPTFNFMESNFSDSLISKRKYVNVKKHSSVSKPIVVDDDDSLNLGKTSPNASNSGSDSNKLRFTFGANDEFKLGSKVESSGSDFVFGATNESEANGTTVGTTTNVNDSHLVDALSELNLGTDGGPLMIDNKCKTVENDASENVGFLFPSYQKEESKVKGDNTEVKSGDSVNDTLEDSGVMFGNGEFNGGFHFGNQNDKRSTIKGRKKSADKKLNSRRAENNSFTFGSDLGIGETTQSSSSSSSKKVILKSVEGESHEIDEKVALQSQTIKHMIEDECADNIIPLLNITSETLSKVIEYCKKHVESSNKDEIDDNNKAVEDDLKKFDAEFVRVNTPNAFDIIMAANFLNIKNLLDMMCQSVGDRMKGKSPKEIRKIFKIKNDFTREEEEEVRKENPWVYEGMDM